MAVQVALGLTAPLLAMVAISRLQKAPESVPFQLAVGATSLPAFSRLAGSSSTSRGADSAVFLWLAIVVDMGAAAASAAAAAFLYRMGGRASAVTDNAETVLWLLLASSMVKLAHWSVAHAWTAIKEKGE